MVVVLSCRRRQIEALGLTRAPSRGRDRAHLAASRDRAASAPARRAARRTARRRRGESEPAARARRSSNAYSASSGDMWRLRNDAGQKATDRQHRDVGRVTAADVGKAREVAAVAAQVERRAVAAHDVGQAARELAIAVRGRARDHLDAAQLEVRAGLELDDAREPEATTRRGGAGGHDDRRRCAAASSASAREGDPRGGARSGSSPTSSKSPGARPGSTARRTPPIQRPSIGSNAIAEPLGSARSPSRGRRTSRRLARLDLGRRLDAAPAAAARNQRAIQWPTRLRYRSHRDIAVELARARRRARSTRTPTPEQVVERSRRAVPRPPASVAGRSRSRACVVLAAAVLLPGLGVVGTVGAAGAPARRRGRAAPAARSPSSAASTPAGCPQQPPPKPTAAHADAAEDAVARTLTDARDGVGPRHDRRHATPAAACRSRCSACSTVLATAGIAMRLGGARAGADHRARAARRCRCSCCSRGS